MSGLKTPPAAGAPVAGGLRAAEALGGHVPLCHPSDRRLTQGASEGGALRLVRRSDSSATALRLSKRYFNVIPLELGDLFGATRHGHRGGASEVRNPSGSSTARPLCLALPLVASWDEKVEPVEAPV